MRSIEVKKGSTRAAHRSLFYAMGYTEEELQKPLIGICCAANEIIPGHMHLDTIAQAAKYGVLEAGGTPIEFPAIGICDGIAMGHDGMKYPLASRELVADSIEAVANGHAFDGLILIPNCDKIVPGMLMAAARLNIPAVVVSGGPCCPVACTARISAYPPFSKLLDALNPAKSMLANRAKSSTVLAPAAAPAPVCSLLTL